MATSNCQFCTKESAKYTCPRCNGSYCGLKCYQGEFHRQCSESFYKECVENEIKSSKIDKTIKTRTLEAVERNYREESFTSEQLDSDDDDDLSSRLEGVDLDDTDQVWSLMTPEERRHFHKTIEDGEIYRLIPKDEELTSTMFWWDVYHETKKIVDLDSDLENNKLHPELPQIFSPKILIDTSSSSPLLKFNLTNILMSYAFAYKHLGWNQIDSTISENIHNFCTILFDLSATLRRNQNFTSSDQAIESVVAMSLNSSLKQYSKDVKSTKDDVFRILCGPGNGQEATIYVHAALSDIRSILNSTVQNYIKNRSFTKKETLLAVKKIEFYICWWINKEGIQNL